MICAKAGILTNNKNVCSWCSHKCLQHLHLLGNQLLYLYMDLDCLESVAESEGSDLSGCQLQKSANNQPPQLTQKKMTRMSQMRWSQSWQSPSPRKHWQLQSGKQRCSVSWEARVLIAIIELHLYLFKSSPSSYWKLFANLRFIFCVLCSSFASWLLSFELRLFWVTSLAFNSWTVVNHIFFFEAIWQWTELSDNILHFYIFFWCYEFACTVDSLPPFIMDCLLFTNKPPVNKQDCICMSEMRHTSLTRCQDWCFC